MEPRKQVLLTQLDDFDAPRPGVDSGPRIATHESLGRAEVLTEELGYLPLALAHSAEVPAAIRRAVILRDQHCRWAGGYLL